jgi:hypothetical protein
MSVLQVASSEQQASATGKAHQKIEHMKFDLDTIKNVISDNKGEANISKVQAA